MTFHHHLIALLAVTIASTNAVAQDDIGDLKDVAAWVNKMPIDPPSFHVTGSITAPTPCHKAATEYTGDSKTNPPGYMVKVTLIEPDGLCIQKVSDINFHHIEENYAGNHATAEVSSDTDTETVDVEVVE